jgi:hypothetical protein
MKRPVDLLDVVGGHACVCLGCQRLDPSRVELSRAARRLLIKRLARAPHDLGFDPGEE